MNRMSRRVPVVVAILGLVIAACSGPASTPTPTGEQALVPDSTEGRADFYVRCFAEHGIVAYKMDDLFPDRDFGEDVFIPEGTDFGRQQEAHKVCMEAATEVGLLPDHNDPSYYSEWYQHAVEFRDCLVEHGYSVPLLPSEEVFTETKGIWDPYAEIGVLTGLDAQELCPTDRYRIGDTRDIDFDSIGRNKP